MLCLNLLATFLEDSAPVSSQPIRCDCLRKGNLYQSLFQAICSGISSICGSITYCLVNIRWETSSKTWTALNSLMLPGFSSTCSAEVLFSSAISSQEPFILPMSVQVRLQLVLLVSFSHWVAPVWSAFPAQIYMFCLLRDPVGKAGHNGCWCLGQWKRGDWFNPQPWRRTVQKL